jgi:hypothetical protein
VWWKDAGVHQHLTFPVHPDPVSGMHCWHQKVRVEHAGPEDRYGDVFVGTNTSFQVYEQWLKKTRPATLPCAAIRFIPDNLRSRKPVANASRRHSL